MRYQGDIIMNVGCISCITMSVIFLIFALIFTLLKEKGAMLISGFNTLSKEERELYDQQQLSLDQRNVFLTYAGILSFGALLSCLIDDHLSYVALIVWLFVFFKGVHIDTEKAFGKYKRN